MLFSSGSFLELIINSLISTALTTIVSVSAALGISLLLNRTNVKFKKAYVVLLTAPMLIPSISHAIGLIMLLGNNGVLTNYLNLNVNLFGINGIVIGSFLYFFPFSFLLINNAFSYEDATAYEAADILGIPKLNQFINITLPNIKKPLIASIFAVFTMVFTDYGVPLMIGGKFQVLASYMYREILGLLNFSNGAIIGVVLLIPAVIAFIIDIKMENSASQGTVKQDFVIKSSKVKDIVSNLFLLTFTIIIMLPIISFVILSFVNHFPTDMSFTLRHVKDTMNLGLSRYLYSSLLIALSTALLGTITSVVTAYITARSKRTFSTNALHLLSMFSLAIPGVVLGLSYVLFFSGTLIYNTVLILVMVNVIHFFSSPYLMAYNSFNSFSEAYNDISEIYDISKTRMLLDVYIPSMETTIYEMFSYFFINAMVTISAVSFLANIKNMPLSLLIPQLDSHSIVEPTAIVSLLILVVNIIFKILISSSRTKAERE